MRCVVCDKCGTEITDITNVREISVIKYVKKNDTVIAGTDPEKRLVWKYDLCISCAKEIEEIIEPATT